MKPLLTVCIPMYNASRTIKKCINSITNSSIDVKIIVIDDDSSDGSYDIVASLDIDSLLLVRNTYGKGPGAARNLGIDLCTTKYITFCDADDFIPDFAYEKLLNTAISNSSDMVIGQYLRKIDDSKWYINTELKDKYISDDYNHAADDQIIQINPAIWNKIYKLSIIKENNIYFQDSFLAEDLEFSSHCFLHCEIVNLIDDVVYFYYTSTSKDNIISTISPQRFAQGIHCLDLTAGNLKILNEKTFSYILNGSFRFLYNKLFLSSPVDAIGMLIKLRDFLEKFKELCNPFLIYSILGKSLDSFLLCDIIDYYIEKKKNVKITVESIKTDIEKKIGKNFLDIPIDYIDIYLNILKKKKAWILIMELLDILECNENYRFIILSHKYDIFKTIKDWQKACDVCKELTELSGTSSNYWFEMAISLKECSKYEESYQVLLDHIDDKNLSYWKLRAELAEYLDYCTDAVFSWKNVALCDSSQFSVVLGFIRNIKALSQ